MLLKVSTYRAAASMIRICSHRHTQQLLVLPFSKPHKHALAYVRTLLHAHFSLSIMPSTFIHALPVKCSVSTDKTSLSTSSRIILHCSSHWAISSSCSLMCSAPCTCICMCIHVYNKPTASVRYYLQIPAFHGKYIEDGFKVNRTS